MNDQKRSTKFLSYLPEKISLLLYLIGVLIVSFFHEPWFDEAVAWDIARDCSIKDILFYVPHYEGHPQLWHLLLAPFAKSGCPYELTLALLNLLFAGTAVALILRYAPIPRPVKLLLPFTYFFFYQYGVISRPYSILLLAFVLLARSYPKKDAHPGRYVLSLILLCSSSAYGIVFAGGITIVWILEIWNRENVLSFLKRFLKDRRFFWMLGLLAYALFLGWSIIPYPDNFAINTVYNAELPNNLFVRAVYMFLILWGDITCTTVLNEPSMMGSVSFSPMVFVSGCFFGLLILAMILQFAHRRRTKLLFIIPAALFCTFGSKVYIFNHHIGVALFFGLFWYWVSAQKPVMPAGRFESSLWNTICSGCSKQFQKGLKAFPKIFVAYALITSLYWTASSSVMDIQRVYSGGSLEANFIKENHLEAYSIWCDWYAVMNSDGTVKDLNVNYANFAYCILPYFDHNIFSNSAYGTDGTYLVHVVPNEKSTSETVARWRSMDPPDILAGYLDLDSIFSPDELSYNDYVLIFEKERGKIWKNMQQTRKTKIYMRKDLAEELGFEPIQETSFGFY